MSEIDYLISQLEFCINSGFAKSSIDILHELMIHGCQMEFSYIMEYKCFTHINYFNESFETSSFAQLNNLGCHLICNKCMDYCSKTVSERFPTNVDQYCAGCILENKVNKTKLNGNLLGYTQLLDMNSKVSISRQREQKLECSFGNQCSSNKSKTPIKLLKCNHLICEECIINIMTENLRVDDHLKCPVPECQKKINISYIRTLFATDSQKVRFIDWETQKVIFSCFNCETLNQSVKSAAITCKCSVNICLFCYRAQHINKSCAAMIEENSFKLIDCHKNDAIPQLRNLYLLAEGKFERDLKPYLNTEYYSQVKKVTWVDNKYLEFLYEKEKFSLASKYGDISEKFLFYNSNNDNFEFLCQFGIQIQDNSGEETFKNYGYGICTIDNAILSCYYKGIGKLLMCKCIIGNYKSSPIIDKNELERNYFQCAILQTTNVNYYMFLRSAYVLPYLLIEFE